VTLVRTPRLAVLLVLPLLALTAVGAVWATGLVAQQAVTGSVVASALQSHTAASSSTSVFGIATPLNGSFPAPTYSWSARNGSITSNFLMWKVDLSSYATTDTFLFTIYSTQTLNTGSTGWSAYTLLLRGTLLPSGTGTCTTSALNAGGDALFTLLPGASGDAEIDSSALGTITGGGGAANSAVYCLGAPAQTNGTNGVVLRRQSPTTGPVAPAPAFTLSVTKT
jgi:hypothetical protein